ncbi:nitrite reductase small subunit NirD [Tuwongella immobilis]|uniref:Rieske domain-containing protein n=1 Tax=Tuwongella immobilis TaxID=692036 RepID=A0A6C2YI83_9BACT|nr:nitrite reductase small subunit NirD [Tuwongella immobilis]VIP00981.1 nitrite reductase : Nitrite reductase (NAD(P)H), small subunit OS=Pseudoxanthomonas suwonensis (strain 11-1) GN=Psesu_0373 PE=4 SV=1: Rieske_2 [Tuwongella immobilis]VTR97380.1 nitrite reductase : Nitrite reductase (NAD(P)H), small subunit OS=Pseudoxanthomonas suwonensis (strain 11-1) GN=Psesu_0373 PE=4 SV=1: Rieske_2 [Tuwongella immobilis]
MNLAISPTRMVSVRVCRVDELPIGLGRAFEIGGQSVAIFRTRSERIFALANRCPHKGGPLADGMLAGESVVCPMHSFRFDPQDGACDQPGICAVTTYPVDVVADEVFVQMPQE